MCGSVCRVACTMETLRVIVRRFNTAAPVAPQGRRRHLDCEAVRLSLRWSSHNSSLSSSLCLRCCRAVQSSHTSVAPLESDASHAHVEVMGTRQSLVCDALRALQCAWFRPPCQVHPRQQGPSILDGTLRMWVSPSLCLFCFGSHLLLQRVLHTPGEAFLPDLTTRERQQAFGRSRVALHPWLACPGFWLLF